MSSPTSDPASGPSDGLEGQFPTGLPVAHSAPIPLTRSQVTALIERARQEGISRRDLMKILAVGGLSAVFAACERPPASSGASGSDLGVVDAPWVKNPEPFIQHPTNLETRLELLDGVITPNELFFVRNHAPTPRIDVSEYRLRVEGDAIEGAVELTMDDLRALPSRSVVAYLECGGNWRGFWASVVGRAAAGGQWGTGGISCAEWGGPTLCLSTRTGGNPPERRRCRPDRARRGRLQPPDAARTCPRFHDASGSHDERRGPARRSRFSPPGCGPRLGGKQQRQMAGSHRRKL